MSLNILNKNDSYGYLISKNIKDKIKGNVNINGSLIYLTLKRRIDMGLAGWFSWMGEHLDKLKVLRSMTKDEKELKIIDEMIAELEAKLSK